MNEAGYWERIRRHQLSRKSFLKAGTAVFGSAALAACGSNGNKNNAAPSKATQAASASAPVSRGSPRAGSASSASASPAGTQASAAPTGTLNIAFRTTDGLKAFNPLMYTSGEQIVYRDAVGEALVEAAKQSGDAAFVDTLAQSHERSSDGLTWTWKLRDTPMFHDGTPVRASDVKFSWEFVTSKEAQHARKTEIVKVLDSIETPDDWTVVFHLKTPYPSMISRGDNFPIIPQAAFQKAGLDGFEQHPIAAGPWKFVSGSKGDRVTLTAMAPHYRKTPFIKDMTIRIVPEEATRIALIQTGEAHIAPITPASRDTVKGISGARVIRTEAVNSNWLVFRDPAVGRTDSPTNDVRVRQAMSLAINRQAIVDKLFYGEGAVSGNFALPHLKDYAKLPVDPYNLDDAKKLLQAAGHSDGFQIDFLVATPVPEYVNVLVADWKKIGVVINLRAMDAGTLGAEILAKKTPGIYIQGTGVDYADPNTYGLFVYSNGSYSYLNKPELDKLMDVVVGGIDDQERYKTWSIVQKMIADDRIYTPLWYLNELDAAGPGVKEWEPVPHNGYIHRTEYAVV